MNLLHFRYRQRLGLLASSSLEPRESDWVREHVAMCSACQAEFAELSKLTTTLREDGAVDRPLPISSEALRTRVLARVRSSQAAPVRARGLSLSPAMAALGLVGVALVAGVLVALGISLWAAARVAVARGREAKPASEQPSSVE